MTSLATMTRWRCGVVRNVGVAVWCRNSWGDPDRQDAWHLVGLVTPVPRQADRGVALLAVRRLPPQGQHGVPPERLLAHRVGGEHLTEQPMSGGRTDPTKGTRR